MEAAARHVISEDNIPETCNQIMSSFPFSAVELALSRDEPLALLQLTGAGEVHVVDRLVQAKALFERLQEQPNAVMSADNHVQHLKREISKLNEFLDKYLVKVMELYLAAINDADWKAELVKKNFYTGPAQIRCLCKLLRAWKAPGWLHSGGRIFKFRIERNCCSFCIL